MKKRSLGIGLLLTGFALTLGAFLVPSSKAEETLGYSTSSLPTTIDLNDTSETNIRSYYSSLNNKSQSERQGNNLLKNLKTILKNGQKYYAYDSSNAIWQIYEIADRDWAKSPASSTTYGTYNSSTNKITNYTYGTSSSSSKNNPYIHALYINRDVTNQTTAWDNHNQDQWGINREHVWPKAEGFETSGAGGARGDPMHLMAGNGYANNIHSNYYYGYVKTSDSYTDCGSKYSNQSGNLRGTSKTLNSGTVFEPQDCDKGDIARAIFYMVARYNYLSGSDSDGIDSNNPNLALTQSLSDWASSGYSSTTSKQGKMGIMTDLLAWHHADPVDEYEIHRNNLLYTNFTNNRNPFIDFPEWADFIWGSVNYNGSTYVSHSTTPTGYATPSSDTINGYNGGSSDPVSVTGVSLNHDSISLTVGGEEVLTANVAPSNATNQAVSWTSSNSSIASVSSSGRVTAVAQGSATITVTTSDGGYTANCSVTVTKSSGPTEASYIKVSSLSALESGNYVIAADTSSSLKGMTYTFSSSKYSGTDVTATNNVISASDGNSIKFALTVSGSGNSRTVVIQDPNANKYVAYASSTNLSRSDNSYSWTVSAGTKGTFRFTSETSGRGLIYRLNSYNFFGGYSTSNVTAGGAEYYDLELFKYTEVQTTKSLDSITLDTSDAPTTFNVGDTFSYEGLTVTANYDDGTDDIVTPTSVSTPSLSSAGQETVTVSYTEGGVTKTADYTITVTANPSILWTAPTINVYSGSTLSGTDVNAWAVTYNDGAGHQTVLTYSQLTVKLGGTTISIPHTWAAEDDGKTLTASYSSLTTSESSAVQITQSVNTINKEVPGTIQTSSLVFTKACGGSGTADDSKTWTVTSDGTESSFDTQNGKGIHYGTNSAAVQYIKLTSNDFTSGKITKVEVNASTASGVSATVSVTVGGEAFGGDPQDLTSSAVPNNPYTFTGNVDSDTIEVLITKPSSATKAIYCKSVAVSFSTSSSIVNIANSTDHIAAQRVAVKFAKAFNAAMDTTSGCTTNLSSAWSTCSSAYSTFLTEAAALGSAEEAYAKDLIKYATVQYSDDSGEACIERMMKTYEICVQKHGQTAFMSELVELGKAPTSVTTLTLNNATNITIIVVASVIMIAAVGGYFYIRRLKQK